MGCGDLRNPLTTAISSSPKTKLCIHINDANLQVISRNILILKIISSQDFNPVNEDDLSYIWDIWYNATWPESTCKRFLEDVQSLLNNPSSENTVIDNSYQETLRNVWAEWLTVLKTSSVEDVLSDR